MIASAVLILLIAIAIHLWSKYNNGNNSSESKNGPILGSGLMFDSIAPYYDTANMFMSLGFDQSWRQTLVQEMNIKDNHVIMDLACGTGEVTILIAKHIESNSIHGNKIYGIDPSINMLALAERKVAKAQYQDMISLQVGNAENLVSIMDASIDKVSISFGIRNVPDKQAALKEIYRVLKPAGKVYVMEFVLPMEVGTLGFVARFFVRHIVPVIGSVISLGHAQEYGHLEKSIFEFPKPSAFINLMQEAGFIDCHASDIFAGVVYIFEGTVNQV